MSCSDGPGCELTSMFCCRDQYASDLLIGSCSLDSFYWNSEHPSLYLSDTRRSLPTFAHLWQVFSVLFFFFCYYPSLIMAIDMLNLILILPIFFSFYCWCFDFCVGFSDLVSSVFKTILCSLLISSVIITSSTANLLLYRLFQNCLLNVFPAISTIQTHHQRDFEPIGS